MNTGRRRELLLASSMSASVWLIYLLLASFATGDQDDATTINLSSKVLIALLQRLLFVSISNFFADIRILSQDAMERLGCVF